MSDEKVIRIPISNERRRRNKKGLRIGYVPCEASGTNGDQDRKLCELVLKYEDLLNAIQ